MIIRKQKNLAYWTAIGEDYNLYELKPDYSYFGVSEQQIDFKKYRQKAIIKSLDIQIGDVIEFVKIKEFTGLIFHNKSSTERQFKSKILIHPKYYYSKDKDEFAKELFKILEVFSITNCQHHRGSDNYCTERNQIFVHYPYNDPYIWSCFILTKLFKSYSDTDKFSSRTVLISESINKIDDENYSLPAKHNIIYLKDKIIESFKENYDYNLHIKELEDKMYKLVSKEEYYTISKENRYNLQLSFLPFIKNIPYLYKSFNNEWYFERLVGNHEEIQFMSKSNLKEFKILIDKIEEYKLTIEKLLIQANLSNELNEKASEINTKIHELFNVL